MTGIGIALTIVALLQLRSAFKNLTAVDQEGFSLPSTLTLLPILAEPLILVGLALFLGGFGSFAGTAVQAQQGTSNSSAVASSLLSSGALWLFFAGIAVYSVAGLGESRRAGGRARPGSLEGREQIRRSHHKGRFHIVHHPARPAPFTDIALGRRGKRHQEAEISKT